MKIRIKCPKCKRDLHPWPVVRPAACAPDYWVNCIRNDLDPEQWIWEEDKS